MKNIKGLCAILTVGMLLCSPIIGAQASSFQDYIIGKQDLDSARIELILNTVNYMAYSQIPELDLDNEVIKSKQDNLNLTMESMNASFHAKLDLILERQDDIMAAIGQQAPNVGSIYKEVFRDDFFGSNGIGELMPWWEVTLVGPSASVDVTDSQVQLQTDSILDDTILMQTLTKTWHPDTQNITVYGILNLLSVSNIIVRFGFGVLKVGDYSFFEFDSTSNPNWFSYIKNNSEQSQNSGIPASTGWYIYKLDMNDTNITFYIAPFTLPINFSQAAIFTTDLPDSLTGFGIWYQTKDAIGKKVSWDYIEIAAERRP